MNKEDFINLIKNTNIEYIGSFDICYYEKKPNSYTTISGWDTEYQDKHLSLNINLKEAINDIRNSNSSEISYLHERISKLEDKIRGDKL